MLKGGVLGKRTSHIPHIVALSPIKRLKQLSLTVPTCSIPYKWKSSGPVINNLLIITKWRRCFTLKEMVHGFVVCLDILAKQALEELPYGKIMKFWDKILPIHGYSYISLMESI